MFKGNSERQKCPDYYYAVLYFSVFILLLKVMFAYKQFIEENCKVSITSAR